MKLRREDAFRLLSETSSVESIVVGGQAIIFWADYFGIEISAISMTSDIDYVATAATARRVAPRISVDYDLFLSTMDNATVNNAQVKAHVPGYDEPVIIDFLSGVKGIQIGDVESNAVVVELSDIEREGVEPKRLRMRILPPLLLPNAPKCSFQVAPKATFGGR